MGLQLSAQMNTPRTYVILKRRLIAAFLPGAQIDQCAPVYFVVGDAGNEEGPSVYSGTDPVRDRPISFISTRAP